MCREAQPKAGRLGCRESRGTKATTLTLPLTIKRGWPVKKDYGCRPEQGGQLQAESNTLFYWIPAYFNPDGGRGWLGALILTGGFDPDGGGRRGWLGAAGTTGCILGLAEGPASGKRLSQSFHWHPRAKTANH